MVFEKQCHENQMKDIEHRHLGRCLWQMLSDSRMIMVELMDYPEAKSTVVVVKHYDKPIPKSGSSKPWPKLIASYIYAEIDDSNTWDGLDKALEAMKKKTSPEG